MMPLPISSLRAAALAVLPLALAACRSEPASELPPARIAAPKGPPAKAFVRIPAVSRVTLSPDGQRIAGLSSKEGVRVVFEAARTSLREVNHLTKIAPETLVHALGWSGNGVLVVSCEQPDASAARDTLSRRTSDGVVYEVETARTRKEREREHRMISLRVGAWRQRAGDTSWPLEVHPSLPGGVIHWLPDDPEHVLINWWPSSEVGASARLARTRDGFPKEVVPATPGVNVWYADHQGRVRAGSGRSEDGINAIVVARVDDRAPFTELAGVGISRETDFEFAGFDADPNIVYLTAIGASGRKELFAYDLAKRLRRAVYADARFDVGALVHSPLGSLPISARTAASERRMISSAIGSIRSRANSSIISSSPRPPASLHAVCA